MKQHKNTRESRLAFVVDSNIMIDLHIGGLLKEAFLLPYDLVAPDVIVHEAKRDPKGDELKRLGLIEKELSGVHIQEVFRLRVAYKAPSINDLFALVLAKTLDVTLLTGDKHLRQAAVQENVSVHGTLWILENMERLDIVTPLLLAQGLQKMLDTCRRLPENECKKLIKRWSGQM